MYRPSFISLLLMSAMNPLFKIIIKHRCCSPETDRVIAVYGYLVIRGVLFNCTALIIFVAEVLN